MIVKQKYEGRTVINRYALGARLPRRGCTTECKRYDDCDGKPWGQEENSHLEKLSSDSSNSCLNKEQKIQSALP